MSNFLLRRKKREVPWHNPCEEHYHLNPKCYAELQKASFNCYNNPNFPGSEIYRKLENLKSVSNFSEKNFYLQIPSILRLTRKIWLWVQASYGFNPFSLKKLFFQLKESNLKRLKTFLLKKNLEKVRKNVQIFATGWIRTQKLAIFRVQRRIEGICR